MPTQHRLPLDDFNTLTQLVGWWVNYPLSLNLSTKLYDELATSVFEHMCKLANKTLNNQYAIEKFDIANNMIIVGVLVMDGNRQQHLTVNITAGPDITELTHPTSSPAPETSAKVIEFRPKLQIINTTKTPVAFNVR